MFLLQNKWQWTNSHLQLVDTVENLLYPWRKKNFLDCNVQHRIWYKCKFCCNTQIGFLFCFEWLKINKTGIFTHSSIWVWHLNTGHLPHLNSYSTVQRFVYLLWTSATALISRFVILTKLNKKITFVGAVGARGKSNKS